MKKPLIQTHHKDGPRDRGLDDPKRAFNGSCIPHKPLDLTPSVETHDINRGYHRHGPQQGYEDQECEIYALCV